jgi:hypothetical protein
VHAGRARGSAGIGRFDHHPRFRREQDYRHAQPREAQPAMSPFAFPQERPSHPCERPEQGTASTRRRRIAPACALCPFSRHHRTVDRVNLASLSPPASSTGSFVHPSTPSLPLRAWRSSAPVRTADKAPIDAGLGPHQVQPRSFADDRWSYQEGFTVYFPRTLLFEPHQRRFPTPGGWYGSRRHASRQEAMAHRLSSADLHFPPMTSRHWPLLRGKRFVHRHTRRRRPDASGHRNHVARTWRGGA